MCGSRNPAKLPFFCGLLSSGLHSSVRLCLPTSQVQQKFQSNRLHGEFRHSNVLSHERNTCRHLHQGVSQTTLHSLLEVQTSANRRNLPRPTDTWMIGLPDKQGSTRWRGTPKRDGWPWCVVIYHRISSLKEDKLAQWHPLLEKTEQEEAMILIIAAQVMKLKTPWINVHVVAVMNDFLQQQNLKGT